MTPYGLTTEQRAEPLGLDEARPQLSWKLASERRGAAQTAYRITAALRETDLDETARLIWDSGRRRTDDSVLVPWDGPALRSATRYYWRVEVWDEGGAPAGTAHSWFETGLLHRDDWTAVWIGRDPLTLPLMDPPTDEYLESPSPAEAPLYLRHEFRLKDRPVRGRLYATAHGVYEPRLNGTKVGDAELAPGWTEYHQRLQYQTYDVTGLLQTGDNEVAAIVADGWWAGYVGFDPRKPARHYGDQTAYLAQLVVDFADGSQQVIATGEDWAERPGPDPVGRFDDGPVRRRPRGRAELAGQGARHRAGPAGGRAGRADPGRCGTARRRGAPARAGPVDRRLRAEPGGAGPVVRPRRRRRPADRAAPRGGRLTWARAEQETARGRAACGWSLDDDRLTVTVTVPPGSTALLEIPTADPHSVRENGVRVLGPSRPPRGSPCG